MTKVCKGCGTAIERQQESDSRWVRRKYCSSACARAGRKRWVGRQSLGRVTLAVEGAGE